MTPQQQPLAFQPSFLPQDRPEYLQIKALLQQYKHTISHQFQQNESSLLQQLHQKTLSLKQTIAHYKKQTSPENIQKLITKKRHQKEAERLQLQVEWRNLTERYKKLKEEEKKIVEENKENQFDIKNLERKILELREANRMMEERVDGLKKSDQTKDGENSGKKEGKEGDKQGKEFLLTEVARNGYTSPYKFSKVKDSAQDLCWSNKLKTKVKCTTGNFRLKLDPHPNKKPLHLHRTVKQNTFTPLTSFHPIQNNPSFIIQTKKSHLLAKHSPLQQQQPTPSLQLSNLYTFQQAKSPNEQSRNKKFSLKKGEKWEELMFYLRKQEVKDKIFDLLRKESTGRC